MTRLLMTRGELLSFNPVKWARRIDHQRFFMRIQYRNLTRPKQLALRLQAVFPALKLTQAQAWTARLVGYRDWHELAASTDPTTIETPDHRIGKKNTPENQVALQREAQQETTLLALMARDVPRFEALFDYLNPTRPAPRFRKLGPVGKGTPCFQGLAWDIFGAENEAPRLGGGYVGGLDWDLEGATDSLYAGLPPGAAPAPYINALVQHEDRQWPPSDLPAQAAQALTQDIFGRTHHYVATSVGGAKVVRQTRFVRHFLIDPSMQPLGVVLLEFEARASAVSQSAEFNVKVHAAAIPRRGLAPNIWGDLSYSFALTVYEPLSRLCWFLVQNPAAQVHVCIQAAEQNRNARRFTRSLDRWFQDMLYGDFGAPALQGVTFSTRTVENLTLTWPLSVQTPR